MYTDMYTRVESITDFSFSKKRTRDFAEKLDLRQGKIMPLPDISHLTSELHGGVFSNRSSKHELTRSWARTSLGQSFTSRFIYQVERNRGEESELHSEKNAPNIRETEGNSLLQRFPLSCHMRGNIDPWAKRRINSGETATLKESVIRKGDLLGSGGEPIDVVSASHQVLEDVVQQNDTTQEIEEAEEQQSVNAMVLKCGTLLQTPQKQRWALFNNSDFNGNEDNVKAGAHKIFSIQKRKHATQKRTGSVSVEQSQCKEPIFESGHTKCQAQEAPPVSEEGVFLMRNFSGNSSGPNVQHRKRSLFYFNQQQGTTDLHTNIDGGIATSVHFTVRFRDYLMKIRQFANGDPTGKRVQVRRYVKSFKPQTEEWKNPYFQHEESWAEDVTFPSFGREGIEIADDINYKTYNFGDKSVIVKIAPTHWKPWMEDENTTLQKDVLTDPNSKDYNDSSRILSGLDDSRFVEDLEEITLEKSSIKGSPADQISIEDVVANDEVAQRVDDSILGPDFNVNASGQVQESKVFSIALMVSELGILNHEEAKSCDFRDSKSTALDVEYPDIEKTLSLLREVGHSDACPLDQLSLMRSRLLDMIDEIDEEEEDYADHFSSNLKLGKGDLLSLPRSWDILQQRMGDCGRPFPTLGPGCYLPEPSPLYSNKAVSPSSSVAEPAASVGEQFKLLFRKFGGMFKKAR